MKQLLIVHKGKYQEPVVKESVQWTTERSGSAGKLTFSVLMDGKIKMDYGDAVRFTDGTAKVFYGFIFHISERSDPFVQVTAFDQLRYFKNKDTLSYKNKTYTQLVRMIADDQHMRCGTLEDTSYVIPKRLEENSSYFDMLNNAYALTLHNTKQMFVLYDDFGKLTLKSLAKMKVKKGSKYLYFDVTSAQDYSYEGSIDTQTYNKIKLTYDNSNTGKREVYIAQDSSNINKWGVLQYYDTLKKGENGQTKVNALLSLYNSPTRTLKLKDCFGDSRVRAGSLVIVQLKLKDGTSLKNFMLVEKATHTWNLDNHVMTLKLRGGVINA